VPLAKGGGWGGGAGGRVGLGEFQKALVRLGNEAVECGEGGMMELVSDMGRRLFFLLLSEGDVVACEEVCVQRGEADLWKLLLVWAGELGYPQVCIVC